MSTIVLVPALKVAGVLSLTGVAVGLLIALYLHVSVSLSDAESIRRDLRSDNLDDIADNIVSAAIFKMVGAAALKMLDPDGSKGVSPTLAVYLCAMSLGLVAGLAAAAVYHLPRPHAVLCPLVNKVSSETCSGA